MASKQPLVGQWYQDETNNEVFEIVALDEYSTVIEIQLENGDLGELSLKSWNEGHYSQVMGQEGADLGFDSDDMTEDLNQMDEGAHWSYDLGESDFDGLGGFEGSP